MNKLYRFFFLQKKWRPILLLFAITFLGYFRLVSDKYSVRWDIEQVHYTALKFFSDEFQATGRLPLWNPSQFGGFPIFADPQAALWYPAHLLLILFVPEINLQTIKWLLFFHISLAGLAMYLYAWRRFRNTLIAFTLGTIYAFSGFIVGQSSHLGIIESYSWFPLLVLFLENIVEQKKLWLVGPASFVGAMVILAGHAQSVLILFTFLVVYSLFLLAQRFNLASFFVIIAIFVLSLGISAIQLIASQELAKNSIRADISLDIAQTESLDPRNLLTFVMPNVFGSVSMLSYWGPGNPGQQFLTIGLIPFIVLLMFPFWKNIVPKGESKRLLFFLIIAICIIMFAFGSFIFLQSVVYFLVPLFNKFRAPANTYGLASFLLIILSGYGFIALKNLSLNQKENFKKYLPYFRKTLYVAAIIALNIFGLEMGVFVAISQKPIDHIIFGNLFLSLILFLVVFISWFLLLKLYVLKKRPFEFFMMVSAALIVFELLTLTVNNKLVATDETVFDKERLHPVESFFIEKNKKTPEPFRVFTDNVPFFLPGHKIQLIGGYNPLMLRTFAEYIQASKVSDGYFQRVMNDLNVRYAYVKDRSVISGLEKWKFIERPDVLSNTEKTSYIWFPRRVQPYTENHIQEKREQILLQPSEDTVWLENTRVGFPYGDYQEGERRFKITRAEPNQIDVVIENQYDAFAVFSEIYYPGWEAYIDDAKVQLYQANLLFRGLFVPSGRHTLSLRFEPNLIKKGMTISLVSLAFGLVMTFLFWLFEKQKKIPSFY